MYTLLAKFKMNQVHISALKRIWQFSFCCFVFFFEKNTNMQKNLKTLLTKSTFAFFEC